MPYKDKEHFTQYAKKYSKEVVEPKRKNMDHDYFFNNKISKAFGRMPKDPNVDESLYIDATYLRSIFPADKRCPILGTLFEIREGKGGGSSSPSVDRIDNKLGYLKTNVHWVCNKANRIMQNATPDEVMAVGLFLYQAYKKSKEQHETL
tara:strand:- start:591 stop:1037 length:447 start_codon:yes stop_codon:yes gene_type:complete